jgi:hypothetical protein
VDRRLGPRTTWLVLSLLFVLVAVYHALYAVQLRGFVIMTDELQYLKLGLNLPHSVLPDLHGKYIGAYNFLYPLLIAPLGMAFKSIPALFIAIHAWNAVVIASVVFPTYLLTRQLVSSRLAGLAAAAIAVAGPWLVFTSLIMTESAAYPAFMWSMLGMQRALAAPGFRRDVIALLSIGLAVSARTQFIVLVPVFFLAIFAERANHSMVLARIRRASEEDAFKTGLRVAAREHRQLLLIGGGIAILASILTLATSPNSVVGLYGTVFEKTIFPRGLGKHMLEHLATIMVGFGILPVVLAGAFVASALRNPVARTRHSFAWLVLLSTAAVLFVSSSFNINFSIGQLNDRYLFYVLPLIAVASVVALVDRDVSWQSIVIAGALAALVVRRGHFGGYDGAFWVGAPASAIDPVLNGKLWQLNQVLPGTVGIKTFLTLVVLAGAGLTALAGRMWRGPAAVAAVSLPVVLFLAIETQYQYDSQATWQRPTPNVVKNSLRTAGIGNVDWVDKAVSSGSVALIPSPTVDQVAWWQDEFWNRRIDKVFRVVNPYEPPQYSGSLVHLQLKTLFHDQVRIDSSDGAVTGLPRSRMTPYVVVANADSRFGFAGARTLAHDGGSPFNRLLQRVDVPYRLAWRVRGLLDDDWIVRRNTLMLLYPRSSRSERWRVRLTLAAPIDVKHTRPWVVTAPGVLRSGRVKPLGRETIRFSLCVRGGAPATVGLRMKGHDLLPDGRKIRLLLTKVSAAPTRARCRG